MAKVLFISNNQDKVNIIGEILSKNSVDVDFAQTEDIIFEKLSSFLPDLILLDTQFDVADIVMLAKKIRINTQTENIIFSLLINAECDNQDLLKTASSYIVEPINEKVFVATIMSNLRVKNSLDVLAKNNADLAKSLYQLDVLYNTSTQFAGSLDREKLIDVINQKLFA